MKYLCVMYKRISDQKISSIDKHITAGMWEIRNDKIG